jgi:hypothetical protein
MVKYLNLVTRHLLCRDVARVMDTGIGIEE